MTEKKPLDYFSPPTAPPSAVAAGLRMVALAIIFLAGVCLVAVGAILRGDDKIMPIFIGSVIMLVIGSMFIVAFATSPR